MATEPGPERGRHPRRGTTAERGTISVWRRLPAWGVARVVIPYAGLAAAWILTTDVLLQRIEPDPARLATWSLAKGLVFVLLTSGLLVWFLHRELAARDRDRAALEESEERLRSLSDNLPDSLLYQLTYEPDGTPRFLFLSEGVRDLHGVSAAAALRDARLVLDQTLPEHLAALRAAEERSRASGEGFTAEFEVRQPCGRRLWLRTYSRPRRRPDGVLVWDGVVVDITFQREGDAVLRERQRLLDTMGTIAKVGGWEFDVRTGNGTWTKEVARIHDMDPAAPTSEALGLSVYTQDSRERIEQAIRAAIESRVPYDLELEMVTPAGRRKWVRTIGEPVVEGGVVARLRGSFQDVTAQRTAEDAVRRQAERLVNLHAIDRAILEAVDSPEGIVQVALRHLHRLLGCARSRVGLLDAEENRMRILAALVRDGEALKSEEVLARPICGDPRALEEEVVEDVAQCEPASEIARTLLSEGVRAYVRVPLVCERGPIGALCVGWDAPRAITAEEREIAAEVARQVAIAVEHARLLRETRQHASDLEVRVAERTAALEAANRELEAFSYSVSHDLRAPLRAVDGYSQILLDEYGPRLDDEGRRIAGVVRDSARDMSRLIDDLLSFSRIARAALQPSPVDMTAMARAIFFEAATPEQRQRIDFRLAELPPAVGDATLLRLVWMNLLSNAVKFTGKRDHPVIEVGAAARGREAVYFVRDNGAGFDVRYADKLFGVFQRLHSAKEFEGTGVGLAIVQRILHRHGGGAWAEGEVDRGATFYFSVAKGA